jgi:hypothetical protein
MVEFREPIPNTSYGSVEIIDTLEGKERAQLGLDYVIKGVTGELCPIKKEIFNETYEVLE